MDRVKLTADDTEKERFDRIAIDIKSDQWIQTPPGIKTKLYSIGVSAFLYKDIPLNKKSNLSIAYGIGLTSDNIHHNGTFTSSTNNPTNSSYTKLIPLASNYREYLGVQYNMYTKLPYVLTHQGCTAARIYGHISHTWSNIVCISQYQFQATVSCCHCNVSLFPLQYPSD